MYIFEYVEGYVCPYKWILMFRNEFQEFSLSRLYCVYLDSTIIKKSVVCLRRLYYAYFYYAYVVCIVLT